jgi:Zn-dependent peptidase ImmA (M78 family)
VIEQVRGLAPHRALTLNEAYKLAEEQAAKLLRLLDITGPHVNYDRVLDLPEVTVKVEPKYKMGHIAGLSRYHRGHWLVLVDKNDVHGRRRFTLGHEIKHVVDDRLTDVLYANVGYGSAETRERQIETLCQYFAACFLMPRAWVTAAWLNGIRDVYNLASLFQVSTSAMDIRMKHLGLRSDELERDTRTFFRYTHTPLIRDRKSDFADIV